MKETIQEIFKFEILREDKEPDVITVQLENGKDYCVVSKKEGYLFQHNEKIKSHFILWRGNTNEVVEAARKMIMDKNFTIAKEYYSFGRK